MTIDLYCLHTSSPCRAVKLTAAAIGLDLNLKEMDLMGGDHLKPEFLKLNPQHCVPTLDDNGFVLWESRAISGYLVDQYAKDDSLYPKDPKIRAVVNQRLQFDQGTLYSALTEYYYPILFAAAPPDPVKLEKIKTALGYLDAFLDGQDYAAGKNLTIADLSLIATITTAEALSIDLTSFTNITKWAAKIKSEAPKYQESNGDGAQVFKDRMDKLLKK